MFSPTIKHTPIEFIRMNQATRLDQRFDASTELELYKTQRNQSKLSTYGYKLILLIECVQFNSFSSCNITQKILFSQLFLLRCSVRRNRLHRVRPSRFFQQWKCYSRQYHHYSCCDTGSSLSSSSADPFSPVGSELLGGARSDEAAGVVVVRADLGVLFDKIQQSFAITHE